MSTFKYEEVVERRTQLNLTREQMAKRLGVGVTSVFHWEKGHFIPRRNRIIEIARVLNCQMSDIFKQERSNKFKRNALRDVDGIFYYKKMEQRRLALGLSRKNLAEKMGVKIITVYQWETEKSTPRHNRIAELAKILKCQIGDIFLQHNVINALSEIDSGFNYQYVERRRIELGISRKKLAERLGLGLSTIYFWGTGRNVTELAKILKCKVSEILL